MKSFRVIYIIEAFTDSGELVMRRFARNKRTAEKIANQRKKAEVFIRKAQKQEHYCINPAFIEG